ncbi:MAG: hypothetical protein K6A69_09705 [Lachnospiraceae bacterium]|nr:hypothetical protein [Lachnospiraceae bacterium]
MGEVANSKDIEILSRISDNIFTFRDEDGKIRMGFEPIIERPEDIVREFETSDFLKELKLEASVMNKYYTCVIAELDDYLMERAKTLSEEADDILEKHIRPEMVEHIQDVFLELESVLTRMINLVGPFSIAGLQRMAILKDYQRLYRDVIFPKIVN